MKTLIELYKSHGGKVSDKWSLYLREYDRLFQPYRDKPITLLEIGIQNGGSLEIWSEYFPNADRFVGCDINPDCEKLTYTDPRIVVIVGDATTNETQDRVFHQSQSFDLIIEDGSHTSGDIVKAFSKYFPALREGGLFVAEDLHCSYWQEFEGGLYDPYSSISFFKALSDIINHQHWGLGKTRSELIAGFKDKYAIEMQEELLSEIHSIEFINSICVVRKLDVKLNVLGQRVVAGKEELVVSGLLDIHGSDSASLNCASVEQTENYWSGLKKSPAEMLEELHDENINLKNELARHLENYNVHCSNLQRVIDLNNIEKRSLAYRIAKPFIYVEKKGRRIVKSQINKSRLKKIYNAIYGWKTLLSCKIILIKSKFSSKDKIIIVSHSAAQDGAPLLVKNLIETYTSNGFEIVTLLQGGGILQKAFAKVTKTIRLDHLAYDNRSKLYEVLRESGYKLALCNTAAVGDIVEGLSLCRINCVSLIHELPYVIEQLNLTSSLSRIYNHASFVIYPSEYVHSIIKQKYGIGPRFYGIRPQGKFLREFKYTKIDSRKIVSNQLGINLNSNIVLGVGTGEHRKGIDLFVKTAIAASRMNMGDIHFVWVGDIKIEIADYLVNLVEDSCISNIHFLPFTKNIDLYYSSADVFFLSSREDPFPSVYIDALYFELPIIGFVGGGGYTEYHSNIGGVLVKDFDCENAAVEIGKKINGKCSPDISRDRVNQDFDFKKYASYLASTLKKTKKTVSVIIPNFNYENYLLERINSIVNQTVLPDEIIFLDDCSTDNSVDIAKKMLSTSGIKYQILTNEVNNGCYKQWLRGIQSATSDIIWIAEADDVAELNFLEKMLDEFNDPGVNLAYCQSVAIDENSKKLSFSYLKYTAEFGSERWVKGYKNSGQHEIENYLAILNIVPNASGALIRRKALEGVEAGLGEYNSCGDWYVYMHVLNNGKISYVPDKLNFHRRHASSIIHRSFMNDSFLLELMKLIQYANGKYCITTVNKRKIANRLKDYYSLRLTKFDDIKKDDVLKLQFQKYQLDEYWNFIN